MNRALRSTLGILAALPLSMAFAAIAQAQGNPIPKAADHDGDDQGYTFTKMADSAADGLDPFTFECSCINNHGDVAFRAGRDNPAGGPVIPGIYRASTNDRRRLTTIAEDRVRFDFIELDPSMNDHGEVSFLARLGVDDNFELVVLKGDGGRLTTVASTADEFNQFGSSNSINDRGVVAFKAQLDNFDSGLFSRRGDTRSPLTTYYLASTSQFSEFGSLSRPSINNRGDVAFEELVDEVFASGIFVTQRGGFKTIAPPDPNPNVFVGWPVLNDRGTVAFHRTFFNEATLEAGEELVAGNGGPLTTIADTRGQFQAFMFFHGFQPPAINNRDDVAFLAELDSATSPAPRAIYVKSLDDHGNDPDSAVRVVGTGDTLDGRTVKDLRFCEQGLNDGGELSFVATFDDPSTPEGIRVVVYRATPRERGHEGPH